MDNYFKVFEYACGKYYKLFYTDEDKSNQKAVSGILINYNYNKLVMLTPKGLLEIPHRHVERLEPREFPKVDVKFPEDFKKLCKEFEKENDNEKP